jgi:hypothetical protein
MYRQIFDYKDWASDNDYKCIHYYNPSINCDPGDLPNFIEDYYPKACTPFSQNSGFVIEATDVTIVLGVFPDLGIRAEIVGRSGSVVCSSYLQFWYQHVTPMFLYGGYRSVNGIPEINLSLPQHTESVDFPAYIFTPGNHFAHWLQDDFCAIAGDLPFSELPILSTPGIPLASRFLSSMRRPISIFDVKPSSIQVFRLNKVWIPTPPPFPDRYPLINRRLVSGSQSRELIIFLKKTSGHLRLKLLATDIDRMLENGVIFVDPVNTPFDILASLLYRARCIIVPQGSEWANIYFSQATLFILYPDVMDYPSRSENELYGWCAAAALPSKIFISCKTVSYNDMVSAEFEFPTDKVLNSLASLKHPF